MLAVVALFVASTASAQAAFPGANGKIAWTSDRTGGLEILSAWGDGSMVARLTNNTATEQVASWSPDGRKLAFISSRDGDFEIYTMNADGSGQTRLTNQTGVESSPTWSPDGTKIVFSAQRSTDLDDNLYTMNADGSGQTRLLSRTGFDFEPAWSPDGTKIAFSGSVASSPEIFTVNADGTAVTRLTTNTVTDRSPSWAPTGTKIAFASLRDGNLEVYAMNADGTSPVNLTNHPTVDEDPAWSPDGSKIAFVGYRSGNIGEIFVMNADGTSPVNITNNTPSSDLEPDWGRIPLHDRPAQADDLNVSLVPDFRQTISTTQCAARGGAPSTHGPPLAFASCSPPGFVPGTTAHFGPAASASAALHASSCPPCDGPFNADVSFTVSMSDIRAGSATGPDYDPPATGPDAKLVAKWRLSDIETGAPGTTVDFDFPVPLTCSPTPDPAAGSTCSANTSANALMPGSFIATQEAIVQSFRVRAADSGADGVYGNGDDRNFAQQGIFIP